MLHESTLRTFIFYDLATGDFFWRKNHYRAKMGQLAGFRRKDGYLLITINQQTYRAHRLAWLYVYGEHPKGEIDHINGDPSDNRIVNLRVATRSQNTANIRKKCNSGNKLKGVTPARDGVRYKAQIRINGKNTYLGTYSNEEEAHAAYMLAARAEFGAFARAE